MTLNKSSTLSLCLLAQFFSCCVLGLTIPPRNRPNGLVASATASTFSPLIVVDDNSPPLEDDDDDDITAPHIAFMGGGIFFYWQAGVITYMREQGYDLTGTSSTGASAGALAATLTACDVDFYQATELALSMAKDAGVWDRKEGLQGIWGPMVRDWLDVLLPENAVVRMQARQASLLVTRFPSLQKQRVSTFVDKQDLIDCNMASVHLPLFLDGQWTTDFRSRRCIDGSFLSKPNDYKPCEKTWHSTLVLSHRNDKSYDNKSLLSFVKALSPDGIYGMVEDGKRYAKRLEEKGALERFWVLK